MAKNKKVKDSKDKRLFGKDFKAELKKVIWPTPKQLVNNTIAVISIVLVIGIIVLGLDLCFDAINKYGINKIRTVVSEQVQQSNNDTENAEENSEEQNNEDSNSVSDNADNSNNTNSANE